ncbi:MBL fold metallo-hydrolase [Shimazuella sp. KC615]|uniref:MBL fold metallo-hydrolase n=2 Tax=Shimazuella alba TaxID=2690964 RepID=A0A6I4VX08_9BACL|nr:MBL fold metallo-hydrolase [Shimazuella alba]
MKTMIQFLGTSDAQGVPRMLCDCAVCRSPQNKRSRPSIFLHSRTNILVDVSPDFRQQFIDCNLSIPKILLLTHAHNDHIAGLGDLADLCFWQKSKLTIISPQNVLDEVKQKYPYLNSSRNVYFLPKDHVVLDDMFISFHLVNHGNNGTSYGIKFTSKDRQWSYVSDVICMTSDQLKPFYHLDLLILGASYWDVSDYPHQHKRSIYDVREALQVKEMVMPQKMILTHMSHDIDISKRVLPEGVFFGRDGWKVMI